MYINAKTRGNNIYISELNQDYSIDFRIERNYRPELFCDSQDDTSEWKDLINNEPLQKITFDNIRDFQDYKKSYKSMGFSGLFNIIEPEYQWIKDNPVTERYKYRVWHIDIETGIPEDGSFPDPLKTEAPITVIQVGETDTKHKYIFAWLKPLDLTQEDVTYIFCRDERHMLEKYAEFSLIRTPIMTTAWMGDNFDFPYIVNRMSLIGLDPSILSPFGKMEEHRTVIFGKESIIQKPIGVVWLDYVDMFKKAMPGGQESWTLEYISKKFLGDNCSGKVKYQELGYEDMKDFIRNLYDPKLDTQNHGGMKDIHFKLQEIRDELERRNN